MSAEDDDVVFVDEDYYARLNVNRNATKEEITSSYRRLSRQYHPDKHLSDDLKKNAELLFGKIKRAYEVLSDPHQRAIYDSLGIKGLHTDGWEIVQRTKTPQEIRDEYERLAREKNERRLQQRTNPRGNVTVRIDATDIFACYEDELQDYEVSMFPNIEISGMSISQSIEAPLTLRDTLTLSGHLNADNGVGSGWISVSSKRLLATNGWVEGEFSAGSGPMASFKIFKLITKTMFGNFSTQFKMTPRGIRLGFVTSLGMPLDTHTHGYLTWNVGVSSSMTTMMVRDTERTRSNIVISLGISSSFLSGMHLWKLKESDLKLRIYGKIGTASTMVECSAEKKVSEQSSLSASVSIGLPSGVTLKIKIIRAHQSYVFPIQLSEEPMLVPALYAVAAPFVVWFTMKKLIVEPFLREQKEQDLERQREINKNRMAERKKEAQAAINLMSAAFDRIRREEELKNGLIILKALYGKNAYFAEEEQPLEAIEVTIPLQCLVNDSQLILPDVSKSHLSGFYDPCVGEDKVLFVRYTYHSHLHKCCVKDNEPLWIPKQSHRTNGSG